MPVHRIALALDITRIREEKLHGFEGALVTTPERDVGEILINSHSSHPRRRFTIGHELGHFLNPWHKPIAGARFECTRADMALGDSQSGPTRTRHQRQELEANLFAIELLTPRPRLRPHLAHEPDLRYSLQIADEFEISKEAAVRRYVALHEGRLAVVFSRDQMLVYVDRGPEFPPLALRKGDSVPPLPKPRGYPAHSAMEAVDPSDWLSRPQSGALYAQTLHQQNGYRTTLLFIDTQEDEGDDPDPLQDPVGRFATRDR
ncbi:MAG: ImmA/IrrE family metallo-endopeptidase [Methylobacteriaceae bacterium]|nr:ImmA/IrrE family metallo-endopeptidase [Methylobacteriaceae bacterium]